MDAQELVRAMVEIPSYSGEEGKLARFLVQAMEERGFAAGIDGVGNAVGMRSGASVPGGAWREVLLVGHMDTVPGWIPVQVRDGRLHGRGSVDAKGPLAVFIEAVARCTPAPGVRLVVVGAVEEESATSRGARHLVSRHAPEACVIGEPSGWDAVTLGYKGRLVVRYQGTWPVGHGAGPEPTAGERFIEFWDDVRARVNETNAGISTLFGRLLVSLRGLSTTTDGLTETAGAEIGFRLPPDFDTAEFRAWLIAQAGKAEVAFRGEERAWSTPRTSPLARAFLRAIRTAGGEARGKLKTGTSDLNVLGPAWGCPIVAYGPGDSRLDHTPHEHLDLDEYHRAIGVLANALVQAGWVESVRGGLRRAEQAEARHGGGGPRA